jgi:hypothetical protein
MNATAPNFKAGFCLGIGTGQVRRPRSLVNFGNCSQALGGMDDAADHRQSHDLHRDIGSYSFAAQSENTGRGRDIERP